MKGKRTAYMLLGILLIGISVAAYRMSGFGVDPFSCMNLGISRYLEMSFGNWQLLVNIVILIIVFFTVRWCIGIGTIINMVFVGYIADFLCWVMEVVLHLEMSLPLRILMLCIGMLFASSGVAFYMTADMGIAPYDSVAFIIRKMSKEKIPFQYGRICSDVIVMAVGVGFSLLAGNSVWTVVGLATVLNSLCNGPLIQFFRTRLEKTIKKEALHE